MMDGFEMLHLFGFVESDGVQSVVETEESSVENYLQREEKILSLLRKKKPRFFEKSMLFESMNLATYRSKRTENDFPFAYLLKAVSKVVENTLNTSEEAFRKLFTPYEDFVSLEELSPEEQRVLNATLSHSNRISSNKQEQLNSVKVVLPFGERKSQWKHKPDYSGLLVSKDNNVASRWNCQPVTLGSDRHYRYCVNPEVFSLVVLLMHMRKQVQTRLHNEEKSESVLYHLLEKLQRERLMARNEILVYEDALSVPYIKTYLETADVTYRSISQEEYEEMKQESSAVLDESDFIPAFLMAEDVDSDTLFFSVGRYVSGATKRSIRVSRVLVPGSRWNDAKTSIVLDVFDVLVGAYEEEKRIVEFERQADKDFAKVWQTKKNIPQKMLSKMENSSFNDWFGYVEFDEECDLEKIAEIEKEFQRTVNMLGVAKQDTVSVRFRKLGHHKAAGLWFPYLRCLCVDVRYPSSMIHEYFHMLDSLNGDLSEKYSFYEIRKRYEELVREDMKNASEEQKRVLQGKSKYNLSYYLIPTEIFARCGEMYMVRHRKVNNSLVKDDGEFGYPKDDILDRMISRYFDAMFNESEVAA